MHISSVQQCSCAQIIGFFGATCDNSCIVLEEASCDLHDLVKLRAQHKRQIRLASLRR